MTADLSAILARLETWLAEHTPDIHAELTPGVADAELDALEAHIGLKVPETYRLLYRVHGYWGGAFGLGHLTLDGAQFNWNVCRGLEPKYQEVDGHISHPPGAIKTQYINLGWVPLLEDGGGNFVSIDLDPGPSGRIGQVITFGRDENDKYVLAESLEAFLNEYVSRLEAGRATITMEPLDDLEISEWPLLLHDADGDHQEGQIRMLADVYPGFGAAPARRSR